MKSFPRKYTIPYFPLCFSPASSSSPFLHVSHTLSGSASTKHCPHIRNSRYSQKTPSVSMGWRRRCWCSSSRISFDTGLSVSRRSYRGARAGTVPGTSSRARRTQKPANRHASAGWSYRRSWEAKTCYCRGWMGCRLGFTPLGKGQVQCHSRELHQRFSFHPSAALSHSWDQRASVTYFSGMRKLTNIV